MSGPSAATNSCNLNCNAISCTTTGVVCVVTGIFAIAQKHQLPVPTVQSVIARAERAGGNPVAPRGHKLNSAEQAKLCSSL